MPISVTGKNYTLISTCDLITSQGSWSGVDTPDTVDKKQGNSSLCGTLKASGNNDTTFIPTGSPTTKLNLSNKHVRFWFLITSGGLVNLYANGGIQFWATDGTNTGYWYVGGRDTYAGGWQNFVVDMSKPVDAGTKPSDMTQITQIGTRHNLTTIGKNVDNVWIDHFSVCDGLVVSGDIDSGVITCGVNETAGTYTRSAGSFLTDLFRVGMGFTASGYSNGGNNGNKTISTVTATVITVTNKTGLVTESGTGDERIRGYVGLQDIFNVTDVPSTSHGIGILTRKAGVYCLVGSLEVGSASSLTRCNVKSQAVVFENRPGKAGIYSNINTALMNITITDSGNSSYTTEFVLGSKSGTQGISGCVIRVQSVTQLAKFTLVASGANVDNFKLYGCNILGATSLALPVNASGVEVLNTSFEVCGEILASTAIVKYCNIISATSRGIRINSDTHNVTDSNFIACPQGVNIPYVGDIEIEFTNLQFSGCGYDVEKSGASGALTVKNVGSNAVTYTVTGGGTVDIQTTVYLKVYVKDKNGDNIENAQVGIFKQSDMTQLMNEDTVSGYSEETFNYGGGPDVDIYLRVRKSSTPDTKYVPMSTIGTITSTGFTYYAVLIEDAIA